MKYHKTSIFNMFTLEAKTVYSSKYGCICNGYAWLHDIFVIFAVF